ncbi:MAG TPA: SDR family oxidoreductase [Acidimicrobiales bacterium]|jgi:NAD(P)-dependent dehydrogenase (short-subunit alcohol dehydrogenase family)|nr:SDR family oxidoreductase [Acidimicrobiales bacterium]
MAGEKPLEGQAALVTGGGGGIGGASAAWLARDGAAVTIMGRTEETLVNAQARIREFAGSDAIVHYFVGDALQAASLKSALQAATALTGRLGIAVSVVGGGTMKPLLMFEDDEVLEEMRRNIVSAFLVIRHAAPLMIQGGGGSIVCISSDAAKIPWPFLTTYNTSKSGLEGLVRGAALELGSKNVRVNAVRPGLVKTDTTVGGLFANDAVIKQFIEEKPLGRTGVPDDIAAGVRYLAGPESAWVTGQSIGIEGGNELTKAPYLESLVRKRFGDKAIDDALAGRV